MVAPALSVTVVAATAADAEPRLLDCLRREGISVRPWYGSSWPTSDLAAAARGGADEELLPPSSAASTASTASAPSTPSTPSTSDEQVLPCYVWFPSPAVLTELPRWCQELEMLVPRPGVLAIAAPDAVEDLLAGGVDDAVPRTISERELVARVRALHRRLRRRAPEGQLRYGALTIDTVERSAWIDGTVVSITPIEQAVLVALIRAGGRALTRVALLDAAWGEGDLEVSERAVDNVILRLRRKLPRPELIETVRGVGFRLATPTAATDARRHATL